ncbi:hypothetical protein [Flavobacterium supellecticarium]|uniref:hypothetical protein n=1 Tax=Flavobacterium supellecticarium TaxID=2565924 RepID=UPI001B3B2B19|nr:hypothetical protein [Flavobacterium supellecticarium]
MKKITFLTTILVVFTAFTFVSCEVESIDPALSANGTNNNGGNTGGGNTGGGNNGGTPSGDYWPTAINNTWKYAVNSETQNVKVIGTDIFNGATYYKFSALSGASGGTTGTAAATWLHKSGGVYTLKTGDMQINMMGMIGTQTGYEMVLLKDNLPVNATWSGTYTQTTTYTGIPTGMVTTTNYTGEILEKNATITVNGVTYTDVIKMNLQQQITMTGGFSITNTEYYFAKNIGPVRITMYAGSGISQSNLVNYTLH